MTQNTYNNIDWEAQISLYQHSYILKKNNTLKSNTGGTQLGHSILKQNYTCPFYGINKLMINGKEQYIFRIPKDNHCNHQRFTQTIYSSSNYKSNKSKIIKFYQIQSTMEPIPTITNRALHAQELIK